MRCGWCSVAVVVGISISGWWWWFVSPPLPAVWVFKVIVAAFKVSFAHFKADCRQMQFGVILLFLLLASLITSRPKKEGSTNLFAHLIQIPRKRDCFRATMRQECHRVARVPKAAVSRIFVCIFDEIAQFQCQSLRLARIRSRISWAVLFGCAAS